MSMKESYIDFINYFNSMSFESLDAVMSFDLTKINKCLHGKKSHDFDCVKQKIEIGDLVSYYKPGQTATVCAGIVVGFTETGFRITPFDIYAIRTTSEYRFSYPNRYCGANEFTATNAMLSRKHNDNKNLKTLSDIVNPEFLGKDCLGQDVHSGDIIHSGDWNKLGVVVGFSEGMYEFYEITKVIQDSTYSYRTTLEFDHYKIDLESMKSKSILLVKI